MELVRNPTMVENVVVRVDEDFLTGKKKKICLVNPIKLYFRFQDLVEVSIQIVTNKGSRSNSLFFLSILSHRPSERST